MSLLQDLRFAIRPLVLSAIGLYAVTTLFGHPTHTGNRRADGARRAAGAGDLALPPARLHPARDRADDRAGGRVGVGVLLQSLLVQTRTRDPVTLASIAGLLSAVAVAASFWPARRATRLDPLVAPRNE